MIINNKKFAFIINYGIEYRMFFISGLLEKLLKDNEVTIITRDINNKYFNEYKNIFNFNTIIVNEKLMNPKRTKIENIFQSIRQSRIKLLGKTPFKNYNMKKDKLSLKDILKGNIFIYTFFKIITLNKIKKEYENKKVQNILQENNITDIVTSGYSSTSSINFAINGLYNQNKVWTFVNSWKDYFINDFLPYKAHGFFVWSESMKNDFLSTNSHINSNSIYSTGNIVFDRFYQLITTYEKSYYEEKYCFNKEDKLLLYCMLDPDRYKDEEKIILLISEKLNEEQNNFKILVKKNPFDSSQKVNSFFNDNKYITVLQHYSQRDKKKDFFIQSNSGEKEWIDLLKYSNYILGAASTVALEAIMVKKSFLTICFDGNGEEDLFLKSLCEIDFYRELLYRKDIFLSKNILEFIHQIKKNDEQFESNIPNILGIFDGNARKRVIKVLKEDN